MYVCMHVCMHACMVACAKMWAAGDFCDNGGMYVCVCLYVCMYSCTYACMVVCALLWASELCSMHTFTFMHITHNTHTCIHTHAGAMSSHLAGFQAYIHVCSVYIYTHSCILHTTHMHTYIRTQGSCRLI